MKKRTFVQWFGMDMIGAVKSNLKFEGEKRLAKKNVEPNLTKLYE